MDEPNEAVSLVLRPADASPVRRLAHEKHFAVAVFVYLDVHSSCIERVLDTNDVSCLSCVHAGSTTDYEMATEGLGARNNTLNCPERRV